MPLVPSSRSRVSGVRIVRVKKYVRMPIWPMTPTAPFCTEPPHHACMHRLRILDTPATRSFSLGSVTLGPTQRPSRKIRAPAWITQRLSGNNRDGLRQSPDPSRRCQRGKRAPELGRGGHRAVFSRIRFDPTQRVPGTHVDETLGATRSCSFLAIDDPPIV
jgi:hypothetical protein